MSKVIIEVDYQGDRSIEEYAFKGFNRAYLDKLEEIESYSGKIDGIKVVEVFKSLTEARGLFLNNLSFTHVDTTHVGMAIRRARKLSEQ